MATNRDLTPLLAEHPELAKYDINTILDAICPYDLGVWAEHKRGLKNAPYQWDWYDLAMHESRLSVVAPREHGKCLPVSSLVASPNGWIPLERLNPGEKVFDGENFTEVVATQRVGQKEALRFTTENNRLVCSLEHKVLTDQGWTQARWIQPGMSLAVTENPWDNPTGTPERTWWEPVLTVDKTTPQRMLDIQTESESVVTDGVVTHNSEIFSVNLPAWKSIYDPGHWTYIFCNTGQQSERILGRIVSVVTQVAPYMLDRPKVLHNKEVVFANDSRITVRGSGSAVRGAHPELIIGDDAQDENNTHSQMQRDRLKAWWFGTIGGMAHPGTERIVRHQRGTETRSFPATRIILVGTPFHSLDLLMSMKENEMYKLVEYSAAMPA